MFTQCPKCQSVFMVSNKDTKAHEGLVRCGNCYSVFNSSWNLTDDPRNDFIEEPAGKSAAGLPDSQGSGFTFNIMDKTAETAAVTESQLTEDGREKPGLTVQQEDSGDGVAKDRAPESDLEPFPEPEVDDFQSQSSAPGINKGQESLLYFDANDEDGELEDVEEADSGAAPIEDLTILQTPPFSAEIPAPDQDDVVLESEPDAESAAGSLSMDSMWPDSEAETENDDELGLLATGEDEGTTESSKADVEESLPALSENEEKVDAPIIVEPSHAAQPAETYAVEIPVVSDPLLSRTIEGELVDDSLSDDAAAKDEVLLQSEEDAWVAAEETKNNVSMPSPQSNEEEVSPGQLEKSGKSIVADDTFSVAGEAAETDEFFSIESLPKTADEAFSQDNKVNKIDDSVFITSEQEEIDEAYIPISLKSSEEDELFHDLDDFPEPGELSALNYEDTMEINAMLEEANISKEQIESALSAAEVANEEESADGDVEEILLSSDADTDLTEALFSSNGEDASDTPTADRRGVDRTKPFISYIISLMPLGLGKKKAWKETAISDDQTQLIKSLSRGSNKSELPAWVGKYSLLAATSLLFIALLGQVGYFYMDKLVHITPLRPLLEAGCSLTGCTVPKIQNIAKIEQLSSRLTPLAGRDEGFKVSSILVNRDIRSQSFPALELTLTDRAGNMISRRIVTRDKYLAKEKPGVMMPNEAVDISIRFRTPSIRVDGFELRPVSQNWLERSK